VGESVGFSSSARGGYVERAVKSAPLLNDLEFQPSHPEAVPLYVDKDGRVIRFALRPGQSIKEHAVPNSPFYVIVLRGHGWFSGKEGQAQRFGPNDLIVFEPGEKHNVRSDGEELVFVGLLHRVPSNTSERIGGEIGRRG
jgi:quercetin dioxygenase-like cupin family protein